MTGKGNRWGRDRLGRSEPAPLRASTTALPPTYLHGERQDNLVAAVVLAARPAICGCVFEACAGWRVRRLCLPAVLFCGLCLPACHFACHAHCPHQFLPPFISSCFISSFALLAPVHVHVRQNQIQHVCKLRDCPVGSCNTGLQWRPVHRSI